MQRTMYIQRFLSGLPVSSHWSICLCQYHSFDYCGFLVNFEIRQCESCSFVLFQDSFVCLGKISYKFQDGVFYFGKTPLRFFIVIALNLQISLDSIDILSKLNLPIHEHGMCFHEFFLSVIFYNFLCTSLSLLVNPKVFCSFRCHCKWNFHNFLLRLFAVGIQKCN